MKKDKYILRVEYMDYWTEQPTNTMMLVDEMYQEVSEMMEDDIPTYASLLGQDRKTLVDMSFAQDSADIYDIYDIYYLGSQYTDFRNYKLNN